MNLRMSDFLFEDDNQQADQGNKQDQKQNVKQQDSKTADNKQGRAKVKSKLDKEKLAGGPEVPWNQVDGVLAPRVAETIFNLSKNLRDNVAAREAIKGKKAKDMSKKDKKILSTLAKIEKAPLGALDTALLTQLFMKNFSMGLAGKVGGRLHLNPIQLKMGSDQVEGAFPADIGLFSKINLFLAALSNEKSELVKCNGKAVIVALPLFGKNCSKNLKVVSLLYPDVTKESPIPYVIEKAAYFLLPFDKFDDLQKNAYSTIRSALAAEKRPEAVNTSELPESIEENYFYKKGLQFLLENASNSSAEASTEEFAEPEPEPEPEPESEPEPEPESEPEPEPETEESTDSDAAISKQILQITETILRLASQERIESAKQAGETDRESAKQAGETDRERAKQAGETDRETNKATAEANALAAQHRREDALNRRRNQGANYFGKGLASLTRAGIGITTTTVIGTTLFSAAPALPLLIGASLFSNEFADAIKNFGKSFIDQNAIIDHKNIEYKNHKFLLKEFRKIFLLENTENNNISGDTKLLFDYIEKLCSKDKKSIAFNKLQRDVNSLNLKIAKDVKNDFIAQTISSFLPILNITVSGAKKQDDLEEKVAKTRLDSMGVEKGLPANEMIGMIAALNSSNENSSTASFYKALGNINASGEVPAMLLLMTLLKKPMEYVNLAEDFKGNQSDALSSLINLINNTIEPKKELAEDDIVKNNYSISVSEEEIDTILKTFKIFGEALNKDVTKEMNQKLLRIFEVSETSKTRSNRMSLYYCTQVYMEMIKIFNINIQIKNLDQLSLIFAVQQIINKIFLEEGDKKFENLVDSLELKDNFKESFVDLGLTFAEDIGVDDLESMSLDNIKQKIKSSITSKASNESIIFEKDSFILNEAAIIDLRKEWLRIWDI